MKKLLLTSLLACSFVASASPTKISLEDISCSATPNKGQKVEIPVQLTMGAAADSTIAIGDNAVSVGFYPGNGFENQQILNLSINETISTTYDPSKSLYTLRSNGAFLQCFIKTKEQKRGTLMQGCFIEDLNKEDESHTITKRNGEQEVKYSYAQNATMLFGSSEAGLKETIFNGYEISLSTNSKLKILGLRITHIESGFESSTMPRKKPTDNTILELKGADKMLRVSCMKARYL